jgi:pimeloyl-ACP methyl ester carboxylesterase
LGVLALACGVSTMPGCKPTGGTAFADLDYGVATKTVAVGTAQINYVEAGSGERTLVLIHGLASDLRAWRNNIDALARDYRVIAIDLPGYGKSSKGNYTYSMEFFAKVVRGVVRELELGTPTLVGHSMGGQVAMTYALMYPDALEALVLTSPAGLETFEDGEARWLANAMTPEFTCKASSEAIYIRHVQNFHKMPRDAEFMIDDRLAVVGGEGFDEYCRAVSRSVAGMLDQPVHDRLPQIRVPTLVLFGANDQLIPNPFLHGGSTVRLADKTAKLIPGARLEILPRAGHMAQFEQSEPWNAQVQQFLNGVPPHDPNAAPTPVRERDARGEEVDSLYAPGTDPDDAPAPAPAVAPAPAPEPEADPAPDPAPELLEETTE